MIKVTEYINKRLFKSSSQMKMVFHTLSELMINLSAYKRIAWLSRVACDDKHALVYVLTSIVVSYSG